MDWNTLLGDYEVLQSKLDKQKKEDSQKSVTISTEEYHGYQNMLRILRQRELQQIDKAKADEHGYTLKYADKRVYDRAFPDHKLFFVTKTTPVSLKVDLNTAYSMISQDLKDFYNYAEVPVALSSSEATSKIRVADLLLAITQKDDPTYTEEYYVDNSYYGRELKEYVDSSPRDFIFEVSRVGGNVGLGVYEVSYWGTGAV